jgi:hypothetical protein
MCLADGRDKINDRWVVKEFETVLENGTARTF